MKRFFAAMLIACIISICAPPVHAQQLYQNTENRFYNPVSIGTRAPVTAGILLDMNVDTSKRTAILLPPVKDTGRAPKVFGAIYFNYKDSCFYYYNGIKQKKVGT